MSHMRHKREHPSHSRAPSLVSFVVFVAPCLPKIQQLTDWGMQMW